MASGLKYQGTIKNAFNADVIIKIYEDGYSGLVTPIVFGQNPAITNYNGNEDGVFDPSILSQTEIEVLTSKSQSFMIDMYNMVENEYLLDILVTPPVIGEPSFRWFGYLVPDQYQTSFSYMDEVVKVKAVCPLTVLKGIRMQSIGYGVPLYGVASFRELINYAIDRLGCNDLLPSLGFSIETLTNLSLTPDYQSNTLEDMGIDVAGLLDDTGRGITLLEMIEYMCSSMFCQAVFDNGKLYITDMLLKFDGNYNFNSHLVNYQSNVSFSANLHHRLMGNTEVVTSLPSMRETKAVFNYDGIVGVNRDGNMLNWVEFSPTAHLLLNWTESPWLMSLPDYLERRRGNGRAEDPYRIRLKGDNDMNSYWECIATRSRYLMKKDALTLNLKFRAITKRDEGRGFGSDRDKFNVGFIKASIIAYNEDKPSRSLFLYIPPDTDLRSEQRRWYYIDLSGTNFETLGGVPGNWDFSVAPNDGGGIVTPTFTLPSANIFCWIPIELDNLGGFDTSVNYELPPIEPCYVLPEAGVPYENFRIFTLIGGGCSMYVYHDTEDDPPSPAEISRWEIYPVETIKCDYEVIDETRGYNKEVAYVTRDGEQSIKTAERSVYFQPTTNKGVKGSIQALRDYSILGIDYTPNFINRIYRYEDPENMNGGLTLINAMSLARVVSNSQVKIEFDSIKALPSFVNRLNFIPFYDPLIQWTYIYNRIYSATRMSINYKTNEINATCVGCEVDVLAPSAVMYTDTQELFQEYKTNV